MEWIVRDDDLWGCDDEFIWIPEYVNGVLTFTLYPRNFTFDGFKRVFTFVADDKDFSYTTEERKFTFVANNRYFSQTQ